MDDGYLLTERRRAMDKLELLQNIGNEVCEGCGPEADCGEDPDECFRIDNATMMLDKYVAKLLDCLEST